MKVATKYVMGYAVLLLAVTGCKRSLHPKEYVKYVQSEKSGLKRVVVADHWQFTVQYRPHQYISLLQHNNSSETAARLKGTAWFNISIKREGAAVSPLRYDLNSKDEYDSRVSYFLNEAAKNIRMVYNGKDTLRPISYVFENNYNLTPMETMVVGFELPGDVDPSENMQVVYDDGLFHSGIVKALYEKKDIERIPNLIL